MTCFQCGLPVPNSKVEDISNAGSTIFCCTGCYLTHRITGFRGEEGISQALLGRFGIGLLLSMNVMMLSFPLYGSNFASVPISNGFAYGVKLVLMFLSFPVILILGYPVLVSSFKSIKKLNFTIETTVLFGTVSAFLLSVKSTFYGRGDVYYETATMTLTLFTFGRFVEAKARLSASKAIAGFSSLLPHSVNILNDAGDSRRAPLDEIKQGVKMVVMPGDRIAADGVVISGGGSVDEALLTGESRPVCKEAGSEVFGGTLSLDASLVVQVKKRKDDFLISRIERLMEEIRQTPSYIKTVGDTIASYFMPLVILLSIATLIYWSKSLTFSDGLMRMLSVLLIACPCAFGIAAPLAVWKGLSEAVRKGVIIRSLDVLELFGKVKTVFFDKTGTLTSDELVISGIHTVKGLDKDEFLAKAASLSLRSSHPIDKAIVKEARKKGLKLYKVLDCKVFPGRGIKGGIDGKECLIGNKRWMIDLHVPIKDIVKGDKKRFLTVFLAEEGDQYGFIDFKQSIRPSAIDVFSKLGAMKVKTIVLTGDNKEGVEMVKEFLPVDEVKSGLLPEDKVREIESYKKKEPVVVMVGDGLNDVPALCASTIGVAIGCGTELSRESANVNLMGDNLNLIPYLIRLSKKVRRKVYSNFAWAFSYNVFGIYLAVIGAITPLFAVTAMILSSLMIIFNSTRLSVENEI